MSVLGVVLRALPPSLPALLPKLLAEPGVDITHNPGDGRLVLVIEDTVQGSAAATLGRIAVLPELLSSTLVYEYSGPDAPAPEGHHGGHLDWRRDLTELDATRP
ncbi:nitrate reductase NapAB chaperone NapD [Inhella inkyongensis]|uniref:Nitrate reductase NapAB chaperone NapD n=1 Tax=Inhella inkyongensis TaxID=392593 RepID=A0A840S939_9BURK|nr:chaperone NapD [Inhella inkyongensis]MBB5204929.1 nitrate reductase NapAB chaperone NapD [Inhella inkyongensis]